MRRVDLTGRRYGRLTVVDRADPVSTSTGRRLTRWAATCDCGQTVVVRTQQLQSGRTSSCGCKRVDVGVALGRGNRQSVVAYKGAHLRLAQTRGRAADHACSDCGAEAAEWSYEGDCPDELQSREGWAYCLHPDHYVARCRACHVAHDRQRGSDGRFLPRMDAAS